MERTEMMEPTKKNVWMILGKILLFCALFFGGFCLWIVGIIVISFSNVHAGIMIIFWTLFLLSVLVFLYSLIFGIKKHLRKWSAICAAVSLLAVFIPRIYHWYTVDRFTRLNDRINWRDYDPWRTGTKVVVVKADPKFRIEKDLPKMDGAYALYPVYSGVVRALYSKELFSRGYPWDYLMTNGSDITFQNLLAGKVDLIFSAPPSRKQIADAAAKGLTYEITPYAKEAFVFFVNSRNPVENLTSDQIRRIYSGEITDWSQIDPRYKGKIKPFQRNQGSGSQTMLEKIMGKTPIMKPLREDRLGGMGGIINDVAGYRNYQEALGFTFRYFSTEMFRNGEIKLLSIDGIPPTIETIRNGTYPFLADCCIITVKPRNENVRKIVDFMFSPAGQELVEKTGYVPLSGK